MTGKDPDDGYHLLIIRRFTDKSCPVRTWDKVGQIEALKDTITTEIQALEGYESAEIWLSHGRVMCQEDDVLIWELGRT